MSGICGLLRCDGAEAAGEPVRAMLEAMAYRGPDGLHHICSGAVALGQARLHQTRASARTPLPYTVPGANLYLVFDGRLDNAPELAAALGLAQDTTDAELLAASYLRWGDDCAAQLDGDFAFALCDTSRKRLLCARDQTGTRPFYYYQGRTFFAFASELPPLLALVEAELQPNQDMVTQFLAQCWVSNEDTFWQDFRRLPPAHRLTVEQGRLDLQRYWQPDFQQVLHYANEDDYREHYLELITDIVRRQTRSDYPVAFEVSGGLDSSALFSVANDLHRRGQLQAPDIAGYTLDFRGCGDADEVAYAEAVGRHCGREIERVPPTYKSLEWYRRRGAARGEFGDAPNGVMSLGLYDDAAAAGSRVLVNGTGGDEWLDAGYAAYAECYGDLQFKSLAAMVRSQAEYDGWSYTLGQALRTAASGALPPIVKGRLRQLIKHKDIYAGHLSDRLRVQARQLLLRGYTQPAGQRLRKPWQLGLWNKSQAPYALLMHESTEVLAAARGLSIRRPFWSRRSVAFSISLPRMKLTLPGDNRTLHRRAMFELLPRDILDRYEKAEFSETFEDITKQLAEELVTGKQGINAEWLNSATYPPWLQNITQTPPESANWPLWYLFSCYAALQRGR